MSFTEPNNLHDEFVAAFGVARASDDLGALVDLYEADAVQLQPDGQSSAAGRDQIRAVLEGLVRSGFVPEGTQQRTVIADDIALTSTSYELPGEHGVTVVRTAEVSRRQSDGTWRVVIDAPGFA